MPAVASTTLPPVLAAAAAARTERIRVGSRGVMLPNHAPLVVAEQFARSRPRTGADRPRDGAGARPDPSPAPHCVTERGGVTDEPWSASPHYVDDIVSAGLARRRHRTGRPDAPALRRHPSRGPRRRGCGCSVRGTTPPGWPPRRVCPTCSPTTSRAAAPPRRWSCTAPRTSRARRNPEPVHLPDRQRRGGADAGRGGAPRPAPTCSRWWRCAPAPPLTPQMSVEEAETRRDHPMTQRPLAFADAGEVAGGHTRATSRSGSRSSPTTFGVDEVMVHPVAGAPRVSGSPVDQGPRPARPRSRLLADALA